MMCGAEGGRRGQELGCSALVGRVQSCPPPPLYLICSPSGSLSLEGQGEGVTRRGRRAKSGCSPPTLQSKCAPPPPRDSLSTLVTGGARTEPGEQAGGQAGAVWAVPGAGGAGPYALFLRVCASSLHSYWSILGTPLSWKFPPPPHPDPRRFSPAA